MLDKYVNQIFTFYNKVYSICYFASRDIDSDKFDTDRQTNCFSIKKSNIFTNEKHFFEQINYIIYRKREKKTEKQTKIINKGRI